MPSALKWYLEKTVSSGSYYKSFYLTEKTYCLSKTRVLNIRVVAASTSLSDGMPSEDILSAAACRMQTTSVACNLSDTLKAESAFGSKVMRGLAGTTVGPTHQASHHRAVPIGVMLWGDR